MCNMSIAFLPLQRRDRSSVVSCCTFWSLFDAEVALFCRVTANLMKNGENGQPRPSMEMLLRPLPLPGDLQPAASASAAAQYSHKSGDSSEPMQRSTSHTGTSRPAIKVSPLGPAGPQHRHSGLPDALASSFRKCLSLQERRASPEEGQCTASASSGSSSSSKAPAMSTHSPPWLPGSLGQSPGLSRLAPQRGEQPQGPLVIPALQLGTADDLGTDRPKPGMKHRVKSYLQQQAGGEERLQAQ